MKRPTAIIGPMVSNTWPVIVKTCTAVTSLIQLPKINTLTGLVGGWWWVGIFCSSVVAIQPVKVSK